MGMYLYVVGGMAVGILIGYLLSQSVVRKKSCGTLRVDRSDPDEAPYLFLELEHGGMDIINSSKTVMFKVDLNSYLPRK